MKLTWFGGTTLRVYIGGEIVVVDADGASAGVDRGELLAGAGRVVRLAGDEAVPAIDAANWRPPAVRPLDEAPPVEIVRIGDAALLIAATGEAPLVILGTVGPVFGRWADGAVVVLGQAAIGAATPALSGARIKLLALAAEERALDAAIAELSGHLDGAGLVSLEPGLALEV